MFFYLLMLLEKRKRRLDNRYNITGKRKKKWMYV